MADRSSTPPLQSTSALNLDVTPEQVRIASENRLRAKAKFQAQDRERQQQRQRNAAAAAGTGSNGRNAFGKRPLQVVPADSTSPTAPFTRSNGLDAGRASKSGRALQAALADAGPSNEHFKRGGTQNADAPLKDMIGQYVEYDLSTLKNSRGGFLMEGEEDDPRKLRERQMVEENKRKRLEAKKKQEAIHEHRIRTKPGEVAKCEHCGSTDVDEQMRDNFFVFVCAKCKKDRPDEYSLLTKTECREDYLLTNPELEDSELLPHMLKPNPHRPTYSNMMLFLRKQVEEYAFSDKKWGSAEALDAEFERREKEKKDKKDKKFNKQLAELRKKTKTNVWHRRKEEEHRHVFDEKFQAPDGQTYERCACGFQVPVDDFSF